MIKIKGYQFEEKFTEINLRQRTFEGNSIISVIIRCEIFPACYEESIINGAVEVVFDTDKIKSLDNLSNIKSSGEIGKVTMSVSKNGIWEHNTLYDYNIEFGKRNDNKIRVKVSCDDLVLDVTGTIVSLYTTSTKELNDVFEMKDFYTYTIDSVIGKSHITKYIVKNKNLK